MLTYLTFFILLFLHGGKFSSNHPSSFEGDYRTHVKGDMRMFNTLVKSMKRWIIQDEGIHSLGDFKQVLRRERDRADRSNSIFSLLAFDVHNLAAREIERFLDAARARIRVSDEIGWFDERRIALMLPDTAVGGAKILARAITENLISLGIPVSSRVYSYPSAHWNGKSSSDGAEPDEDLTKSIAAGYVTPVWKRAMDILGSVAGLFILSPILITIAVLIKIVSPGPIFFKQVRVGRSGKHFMFLKFRTMHLNNDVTEHKEYLKQLIHASGDNDKPMIKMEADPRIIPFGKFIRKACLDELPQLINVFRGDMSLVGPRPCIPYEAEEYLRWHSRRFDTTPGMTGLWQVSGKNQLTFREMIRLDIQYAAQRSLLLDFYILFKTPFFIMSEISSLLASKKRASVQSKNAPEAAYNLNT